ncbi:MAG: OB-fold domain-containing protein [Quisquiliibacterium sp.]
MAAFPENREFWLVASQGRLVLRHCDDCNQPHWYPRAVCPLCGGEKLRWMPASGRGTLYAFSTARRIEPPTTLAYVKLDEGPTLMTNIVDANPESLRIGQQVTVRFLPSAEGRLMPFFAPVAGV